MLKTIQTRRRKLINTDPQRRCYNGCNYNEELTWTGWEDLDHARSDDAENRMQWWKELNDDAVKDRGESARREFRIKENEDANIPALS